MNQKTVNNGVAAIIITYNGDSALVDNMRALLAQCERVIIVDNNSTADMSVAFEFAAENNIEIIKNPENLGIATALNIGVRHIMDLGFKYYLTMDQDSVLLDGCVSEMLDVLCSSPKMGSVFPVFRGIDIDFVPKKRRKRITTLFAPCLCITSGNLVKTEVFEKTGGYEGALFIDPVDFDFSFRTRRAGYKMAQANNAFMRQQVGSVTVGRFGKRLAQTPSVFRYYYIGRNFKYVWRTHFFRFPLSVLLLSTYEKWLFIWRMMLFSKESKAIRAQLRRGKKDYKTLVREIKQNGTKAKLKQKAASGTQNRTENKDAENKN